MLAVLTAPAAGISASAQTQNVNGSNLRVAHFNGGRFELTGPLTWSEYARNGTHRYTFREVSRDGSSIYLREDNISVSLQINTASRVITGEWPGVARHTIYNITRMEAEPRTGGPLIVKPPTAPQPPVSTIVTGNNIMSAEYQNGRFDKIGSSSWGEVDENGRASNYSELGHDRFSVFLYDTTRDAFVEINTRRKMIRSSRAGGALKDTNAITGLSAEKVGPKPPTTVPQSPGKRLSPLKRVECLASGGKIERAGIVGGERCTRPYVDGGQSCTDGDQCQGNCVADLDAAEKTNVSGTCQIDDNPFGCFVTVENGQTGPGLCVD